MIEDMHEVSAVFKKMQEEQSHLNGVSHIADAPDDVKEAQLVEVKADECVEEASKSVANAVENLPDVTPLAQSTPSTEFDTVMQKVKLDVLAEASVEDKQFVDKVKKTLKSAAVKHSEVEEKRADFEKQKVDFASDVLHKEQQKNEHRAIEDKWLNKERKRRYHYNGVKPIMRFVDIEEPLNLFLLYLLTIVLSPFFLLNKLLKGTIGALIAGASDSNRPKAVKGFLWTLVAVIATMILAAFVYLFLKWQGLI